MYTKYIDKIKHMTTEELIKEFFSYLDYTEETDSGREFHPIVISSCRVLMSEPLDVVLKELRARGQK